MLEILHVKLKQSLLAKATENKSHAFSRKNVLHQLDDNGLLSSSLNETKSLSILIFFHMGFIQIDIVSLEGTVHRLGGARKNRWSHVMLCYFKKCIHLFSVYLKELKKSCTHWFILQMPLTELGQFEARSTKLQRGLFYG